MALIAAREIESSAPEWLVDEIIPRVGLGFVYGASYWGKSLLTNGELALAVANGKPFFGRATVRGSVIVALGEGVYDAGVRKSARIQREKEDRARDAGDDFPLLNRLPDYNDDRLHFWPDAFTIPVTRTAGS